MSIEKPTDDFELLLHIAEDPIRFLGARSLPLFEAFTFGYRCALPEDAAFRELPAPHFEDFVQKLFPAAERWPQHLSATCYVHFLGNDDASAFDLYVEMRRKYFAAYPPGPKQPMYVSRGAFAELLTAVRQRPRMYFSRTSDLMSCLVALFNGCIEAERLFTGISATATVLESFQIWMSARYPWTLGRPWHRVLLFQNLWDSERSLIGFWTHFDLFQDGRQPDAMTPKAEHLFETNPGLKDMSEAQRKAWQRQLDRIFYRE
jgi:hypothetical protein